jgi:hypothetical protein
VKQKKVGGNRECVLNLEKNIPQYPFQISLAQDFYSKAVTDEECYTFFHYAFLAWELISRIYNVSLNREILLEQMLTWFEATNRKAKFHGRYLRLFTVGGG